LSQLLERARAPGAGQAEVDALLSGLALPLAPGEDAGARADLLHDILEDKRVGSLRGSTGQRVAYAAVEALVALGEPYSLAVSPELLAKARAHRSRPVPRPPGPGQRSVGVLRLLLLVAGVLVGAPGLCLSGYILFWWISTRFDSLLLILHGVPMLMGLMMMGIGVSLIGSSILMGRREKSRD
jgi:hypothetical protein